MVGANVKAETKGLIERRCGLEEEMNAIITRLTAPNAAGLSGNIVDHQGFPRSDIDVGAVLSDRHHLAMLRNDHKDITAKIEQNLHILLSGGLIRDSQTLPQKRSAEGEELGYQASSGSSDISSMTSSGSTHYENAPTPMDEDVIGRLPFAVVDEIFEGSPAATDGLQLGDQILKFGNVEGSENLVSRLARESQTNQGHAIPVIVMRRGVQVHLTVTPRIWSGRGLLGCRSEAIRDAFVLPMLFLLQKAFFDILTKHKVHKRCLTPLIQVPFSKFVSFCKYSFSGSPIGDVMKFQIVNITSSIMDDSSSLCK